jgi:glycosyltransferase involved in cell wall biosynthesis
MRRFDAARAARELPESVLVPASAMPADRRPRLVSTGFVNSLPRAFSGSSYYLTLAGMDAGKLEGGFTLQSSKQRNLPLLAHGAIWKAMRRLKGQRTGGFKFDPSFHDRLWGRYIDSLEGADLINNFQLYGKTFFDRRERLGIGAYYYIDGTFRSYFDTYREFDVSSVDDRTIRVAVEREREDYHRADHVVTMSRWDAHSLREQYGISPERISVVPPGANIPDELAEAVHASRQGRARREFTLGFVGLYPLRKGLDRLAKAVAILRGRGVPVRLLVIGRCPEDIQNMDGVDFRGFINKSTDMNRFVEAIREVDLGCQLSRAELTGIAMLEFLRLGIPVLGTKVGGAPDIMSASGSIQVEADVTAEELAEAIARAVDDSDYYAGLARTAEERRDWASWTRVADEIDAILIGRAVQNTQPRAVAAAG